MADTDNKLDASKVTLRSSKGKGEALTWDEVDENFIQVQLLIDEYLNYTTTDSNGNSLDTYKQNQSQRDQQQDQEIQNLSNSVSERFDNLGSLAKLNEGVGSTDFRNNGDLDKRYLQLNAVSKVGTTNNYSDLTGAPLPSSNTNGYYIKYPNGFIDQWASVQVDTSTNVLTWTFPVEFTSVNSITVSYIVSYPSGTSNDNLSFDSFVSVVDNEKQVSIHSNSNFKENVLIMLRAIGN